MQLRFKAAVALVILVAISCLYWNTLGNEFVSWDDRKYIYENPLVVGDGGIQAIWADLWNEKPRTHYYPMAFTSFWIEKHLVGLTPPDVDPKKVVGHAAHPLFHIDQMVLHAVNALLIFLVLTRLGAGFWPSAFTAVFFAVHPVNVASVAWMSERKNLLSSTFFWLSLLTYIKYRQQAGTNRRYLFAIVLFIFALVSKSATLVLAPLIVVTDRLLDRRWTWASVKRSIPFFILGIVMISITAQREAFIAKSWNPTELWIRPFIAVAAIAHYVVKMFLPVNQAIIYPRWAQSLAEPRYWLSILGVGAATFFIVKFRERLGDLWLWGLALFLITVSPVIGLKYFIWNQFSFVSDHYMYLGSSGVILMVVLLAYRWCLRKPETEADDRGNGSLLDSRRRAAAWALALVAFGFFAYRTIHQNRTWKNNFTLYAQIVRVSPGSYVGNDNLANNYFRHGDYANAAKYYEKAYALLPGNANVAYQCGLSLSQLKRYEEALPWLRKAAQLARRRNPRAWSKPTAYANLLLKMGRKKEALEEYETILRHKPPNAKRIRNTIRQIFDETNG